MKNPNILKKSEQARESEATLNDTVDFFEEYYSNLSLEDINVSLAESDNTLGDLIRTQGIIRYRGQDLAPDQIDQTLTTFNRSLENNPRETQSAVDCKEFITLIIRNCSPNMESEQLSNLNDLLITYYDKACLAFDYANINTLLGLRVQDQELQFSAQQFSRIIDINKYTQAHYILLRQCGSELSINHFNQLIPKLIGDYYEKSPHDDQKGLAIKSINEIIKLWPEDQLPSAINDLLESKDLLNRWVDYSHYKTIASSLIERFATELSKKQRKLAEKSIGCRILLKSLIKADRLESEPWIASLVKNNWQELLESGNIDLLRANAEELTPYIPSECIDHLLNTINKNSYYQLKAVLNQIMTFKPDLSVHDFCQIFNFLKGIGESIHLNLTEVQSDFFTPESIDEMIENESGDIILFLATYDRVNLSEEQARKIVKQHLPQLLNTVYGGSDMIPKLEHLFDDEDLDAVITNFQAFDRSIFGFAKRNLDRLKTEQLIEIIKKNQGENVLNGDFSSFYKFLPAEIIDKLLNKQELEISTRIHMFKASTDELAYKELTNDKIEKLINQIVVFKQQLVDNKDEIHYSERVRLSRDLEEGLSNIIFECDNLTVEQIDLVVDNATENVAQALINAHKNIKLLNPQQIATLAAKFGGKLS